MLEPVSISAFALSTPITQKNITPAINAPSGAIYIDEKSSNVPKIFPSSTNKPIANATIHTPITAIFLSICKLFCIASIGTSNKHTSVVIDAHINDIKNNIVGTSKKYDDIVKEYLSMKKPSVQVLSSIIDKIVIDENKNIEVYYKFKPLQNGY